MNKKINLLIFLIVSALLMSGCMLPIFGNNPPVIESSPKLSATAGSLYNYQVTINEDASENVVYSLVNSPDGMVIDSSTGLISWTPEENQVGTNIVSVKVTDGWYKDTQDFSIEVSLIKLSSIVVIPTNMSFLTTSISRTVTSITAFYSDGSSASIEKSNCSYQSSNNNVATVSTSGIITPNIAGDATITVNYTEDGITESDTIVIKVSNPAPPPSGG